MANVPESSAFDAGIYQIETADPVLGGVNGIANAQARGLANRTKYLYDQQQLKAPLASPAFTGNPTAPTPANGDNDTSLATTQFVNTALANSGFAPLASPAFTGNPTVPNALAGDNDSSVANTAFVKAALDAIGSLPIYANLKATNGYLKLPSGLIIQWGNGVSNGAGSLTVTFPVAFPTAMASAALMTSAGNSTASILASNAAQMTLQTYVANTGSVTANMGFYYIVIGY